MLIKGDLVMGSFLNNLFRSSLKVNPRHNPKVNKDKPGKTYVISDIHGMYGSYMKVISQMTPKDHLIILGDVLDRGSNGIKILQDIMNRKRNSKYNPKITFLLGNHEKQFLDNVGTIYNRHLSYNDVNTIVNRMFACSEYNDGVLSGSKSKEAKWGKELLKYEGKYQQIVNRTGLTDYEANYLKIWLVYNGGKETLRSFYKLGHTHGPKAPKAMYSFLYNSYVALPQEINGRDFLFVHSMPPADPNFLSIMKQTRKGIRYSQLTDDLASFMLEERHSNSYKLAKRAGFTTICGHTPNLGSVVIDNDNGFIRIDAGCGHRQRDSRLALFCFDNGNVEMINEKEFLEKNRER